MAKSQKPMATAKSSLLKDFQAAAGDVGNDDGGDARNENGYTTVAGALDLDKGALDTIEGTTEDLHGGALGEVYLIGVEVDELIVVAVAHGDELLHLTVGNHDGDATGALGTGEVLEIVDLGLQCLQGVAGGVGKQQVADGWYQTTLLALLAVADDFVTHGDEATD